MMYQLLSAGLELAKITIPMYRNTGKKKPQLPAALQESKSVT
jgi:hypothetical protein